MEENLYPVSFEGKLWNECDCDDIFVAFYTTKYALAPDCSVYVSEGDRIQPNGNWI